MSFPLFLIYLVMSFIRPDAFAPGLAAYRPMAILMALALPAAVFAQLRKPKRRVRPAAFTVLVLLVASIAASQIANHWLGGAAQAVSTFLPSAAIALLAMLNLTDERRLRIVVGWIELCIVGLTAMCIYSYYTGYQVNTFVMAEFGSSHLGASALQGPFIPAHAHTPGVLFRIRSVGFLQDPNDFAQMIVVTLLLLFGERAPGRLIHNTWRVYIPSLILLFGLYLTHSRGALVGLGLVLASTLPRRIGMLRAAILFSLFAVAAELTNFTGGRAISDQDASAANRIDFWNLGIHLLAKNPVFGVGFSNFSLYSSITAHNSFVLCFAELGLVGFFWWMAFIILAYQSTGTAILASKAGSQQQRFATALRGALIGFLGCAWFLSRTYEPGLYIVCGLCLAASGCLTGEIDRKRWGGVTIITMLVVLIAVYGFVVLQRVLGR